MPAFRRLYLFAVALTALFSGCQRDSLRIEGSLSNLADGVILMSVLDSSLSPVVVDTAVVANGHFVFDRGFSIPVPERVVLSVGNQNMNLFLGNDDVSISGNILRQDEISVSGSPSNDALLDYASNMPDLDRMRQLRSELVSLANDHAKRDACINELKVIEERQVAYIRKSINDNADNSLGPYILINSLQVIPDVDELEGFYNIFLQHLPQHKYVRFIGLVIDAKRAQDAAIAKVAVGSSAPDFSLSDAQGVSSSLSSLGGRTVLLDFWASWCKPCRQNNPIVVKAYDKFHSQGLEVMGVSLDQDRNAWLAALADDNLPGIQLRDSLGAVAQTYCVRYIPSCFLIGPDGVIIAKNLTGPDLLQAISNTLNR